MHMAHEAATPILENYCHDQNVYKNNCRIIVQNNKALRKIQVFIQSKMNK